MKKILVVFLALVLCVSYGLTSFAAASHNDTILTVSSRHASRGDAINVPINISSYSNMQALSFKLLYDEDILEIVECTKGSILSSNPIINQSVIGKIQFSYASTSPLISSGAILNVKFKIKNDADYGNTDLILSVSDISDGNFDPIENTAVNGTVTVDAPELEAPSYFELVDSSDSSLYVFWNSISEATGYNLYVNGEKNNANAITDNTYLIENLNSNTVYSIQVSTLNYLTESPKSSAVTYKTGKPKYWVSFFDWDFNVKTGEGTMLSKTQVEEGEIAPIPHVPEREGYSFIGWDKPLEAISGATYYVAQYEAIDYTMIGDANSDGRVNIRDVTAIQRHVAEYEILTGSAFLAADTDGNGVVDINDATLLQQYLAEFDVVLGAQA